MNEFFKLEKRYSILLKYDKNYVNDDKLFVLY